jgi:hypothetical protein
LCLCRRTQSPPTLAIVTGILRLAFYIFGEHFFWVDGDEGAAAAGQDFVFVVEDFGDVDVSASVDFFFAAFDAQGLVQRDGL